MTELLDSIRARSRTLSVTKLRCFGEQKRRFADDLPRSYWRRRPILDSSSVLRTLSILRLPVADAPTREFAWRLQELHVRG